MKVVLFYITVQAERARDIRARFDTFYSLITIAFCEQTPNPSEMKTRFVHVACLVLLIITLQYKQSPFCQTYWVHAILTCISREQWARQKNRKPSRLDNIKDGVQTLKLSRQSCWGFFVRCCSFFSSLS